MGEITRAGLVGREGESEALAAVIGSVLDGRGAVAVIEGEAGIGKTTLVNDFAERAAGSGAVILWARCEELESAVPFAPLVAALECWPASRDEARAAIGRTLRRDLFAPGRPPDDGAIYHVVEGFVGLLDAMALERPTVLVLEDLHWADRQTMLAAFTISRRLRDVPFGLVATHRPSTSVDLTQLIEGLRRTGAIEVTLSALDEQAVRRVVSVLVGAEPGRKLATKVAAAGGNPLFVTELVRALDAEGAIVVDNGVAEIGDDSLPPSLRQTILRGLSTLSEPGLDVLRTASLLGTTFTATDLATVLGSSMADLDPLLREPLRRGILHPIDDRLQFRHDVVREAIYEDIPESVRKGLHREIAQALEVAGASLIQVAEHLVRGATTGDKRAINALIEAFFQIALTDQSHAVAVLTRAIELYEPSDPERFVWYGFVLNELGVQDPDEQEAFFRKKIGSGLPLAAEASLRTGLLNLLHARGDQAGAIAEADRLLDIDERSLPWWVRLVALDQIALVFNSWAPARVPDVAGKMLEMGERTGDRFSVIAGFSRLAWLAFWDGRIHDTLDLLDRCERAAGDAAFQVYAERGIAVSDADELDEALRLIAESEKQFIQRGGIGIGIPAQVARASVKLQRGQFDDAEAELEAVWETVSERRGEFSLWPLVCLLHISHARGDSDRTTSWMTEAQDILVSRGPQQGADGILGMQATLLDEAGDTPAALTLLREWWGPAGAQRNPTVFRTLAPTAMHVALRQEDADFAREVLEDVESWAERMDGIVSADAVALRCRALFESDPDGLVAVVDLYRRIPDRVYERALVLEEAAEMLARAGRTDEAKPLFDEAIVLFEDMGALGYAARAAASMRAAGLRRGARGRRNRPTRGWDALTPTELQVVELVAAGKRNAEVAQRLFVSPHTVSTHLRHVFGKLGISSRVELTGLYADRRGTLAR